MLKDIQVHVDKITLLAKFLPAYTMDHNAFYRGFTVPVIYNNQDTLSFRSVGVSNSFTYTTAYQVNDELFFEYNDTSYTIRMEFNPNKINELTHNLIKQITSICYDFHFSRLDIACDLYNYNFASYNVTTLTSLKRAYYYDRNGNLETAYIGSIKSNRFFRIYNKALEQRIPDMDWWRVELQLRDIHISKFLYTNYDFFNDILVYRYEPISELSVHKKAMMEYILFDINRLGQLEKNQRSKYKKILKDLELDSIDYIHDIVSLSKEKLINTINDFTQHK